MAAPTQDIGRPDLSWGTWGQGLLSEWFETASDLIWPQSVVTYGRMRNDPQIRAVLSAYFNPLLRATWVVDPDGCRDEVVQRVSDDLGITILGTDNTPGPARRRGVIWHRHLKQALPYLTFGHMPFERRYAEHPTLKVNGRPYMQLVHLGQRMPWTIAQMHIDQNGILDFIEQTTQRDPIPAQRLVWYVHDQEGSNWAGMSMLRAAFGAWLLKHECWRVHATSIRRFGMGVPQVTAPAGATQAQVAQAQQLAANMRAGDSAGIGLPSGFQSQIMGMTGSVPDALAFIKYLDVAIAKMVAAGLIELGQTDNGSRALGETFMDLFQLSLQSVADDIATTATSGYDGTPGIVTDLVDQNWSEDEPAPRIVCTDVGENYEVSADALQKLTLSGTMTPDEGLDSWVRKTWRLPKRIGPWVPSSRGLPAGTSTQPKTEAGLTPAELGEPPGDTAVPAAPAQKSVTPAAAAATRKQQDYITASTWEPTQHQDDWEQALAHLLLQYRTVMSAQRTDLVDRAIDAMQSGQGERGLVLAAPAVGNGPDLVTQAMVGIARRAAQSMVDEALRQGVRIDLERVRVDAEQLGGTAQARTEFYAGWMAQQATAKALQVYGPTPEGYLRAADEVDRFLAGLSNASLRDQLGAALTTAQNRGRLAAMEAAPESAGTARYVAAEVLDKNTCDRCHRVDGTEFDSLAAADAAYPTGGYAECEGLMRCRGTVVAVWGGNAPTPGSGRYPYKAGGPGPKVPGGISGGSPGSGRSGTAQSLGAESAMGAAAADAKSTVQVAKFHPDELRDGHGKWTGHGGSHRINPETGRLAAQTPSQFTHPATGHRMGKSEIGDTFEALFAAKGAHLLVDKFGGDFARVSGVESDGKRGPRNTPLDFRLDHTHAGELKTLNASAANQKTAIKAAEVARKEQAAKDEGMKPLLVVQVVDTAAGRVEVYSFPAFASKKTRAMTHLGGYSFGPEDFKAAQEATGHWAQAGKRSKGQGL